MPNPTITCDFYSNCNKPIARFTYTPPKDTTTHTDPLNIMIDPSQKMVLEKVNSLLTSVQPALGSNLMPLVASIDSPFVYAMQYLLGSLEGQCSTTYKDSEGIITFGVGLNLSIENHACPVYLLNNTYPTLNLNYATLSSETNQPQPPLSCDQVNVMLYNTLAGKCTSGTTNERAFVPYMLQLQEHLTGPTCNLGNTLLTPDQIAMLLSMYFNGGVGLVGAKLCKSLYQGNIDSAIRQVVLYSNANKSIALQNRQTFMGNFLSSDVQLPWYQYEKINIHYFSSVGVDYGLPTNGLPYGSDQLTFKGNSSVTSFPSDMPDSKGNYKDPDDLIVYGTSNTDLFNFTSGGSVVAFSGSDNDIIIYQYPYGSRYDESYSQSVSYLAGGYGFDTYMLDSLAVNGGYIQINDPDGGILSVPMGSIAGIVEMAYDVVKTGFPAALYLMINEDTSTVCTISKTDNNVEIMISSLNNSEIPNIFKLFLFNFVSGNYGIMFPTKCKSQFLNTERTDIYPLTISSYLQIFQDGTNAILSSTGSIINKYVISTPDGQIIETPFWAQLSNGYLSYMFTGYYTDSSSGNQYSQLYGMIYSGDGNLISSLQPSSNYPAFQFCPLPSNNQTVDTCSIEQIDILTALSGEYFAVSYTAMAYYNNTCVTPCNSLSYLKLYNNLGEPLSYLLNMPLTEASINGIYGDTPEKLILIYNNDKIVSFYTVNMLSNTYENIQNINTNGGSYNSFPYGNGFIMYYNDGGVSYRLMYNGIFTNEKTYFDSSISAPASAITISKNIILLSDGYNYQLITPNNKDLGAPSFSPSCDADGHQRAFLLDDSTILVSGLIDSVHISTFTIPFDGISNFNIPDNFPTPPVMSTRTNFPPSQTSKKVQLSTSRNLLALAETNDSQSRQGLYEHSLSSTGTQLKPFLFDWLITGLVLTKQYLSNSIMLNIPMLQSEPSRSIQLATHNSGIYFQAQHKHIEAPTLYLTKQNMKVNHTTINNGLYSSIPILSVLANQLSLTLQAALNAYVDPTLWLSDLAKQQLLNSYQQFHQKLIQIRRVFTPKSTLKDCFSPYSTCAQITPSRPLPQFLVIDHLREFMAYDYRNGQPIFTVEAIQLQPDANTTKVIGSLGFFGERRFCRYPDDRHNLIKQTGIFAEFEPEVTPDTELCLAPPPKEASIFDGTGHAIIQGGLAGTRTNMEAFMQRQGYSEKTSYLISGMAFYATLWLVFFIEHSLEAQAASEIMQEDTNINILAAIRACLSIIQVLLMIGIGALFTTTSRYAGERIQEAGWPKMGAFVREAGDKLGKMLPYVDSCRQRGFFNTVACATTGLATQLGVERIGGYFSNKK